jgi:hypothetical protein
MVKAITIVSKLGRESVVFNTNDSEIAMPFSDMIRQSVATFTIEIEFSETITSFRNHDYTWVDIQSNRIANSFSPKIIQLANGLYVQASANQGIWEVQKKQPKKLFWLFNPTNSNPLATYTGEGNQKKIANAKSTFSDGIMPSILFSKNGAIEFSRSKIPFVATACFTDHCDFDTLENLQKQRLFFKQNHIKITKGFFLNHFSKRADNASWQKDSSELQLWLADGHELCYHSLSQSIKNKEESTADFLSFSPPIPTPTWIDHGYQPYNFSLYQKERWDEAVFAENLANKNIEILWNYIDSGTATSGVLNQMNREQFTLQAFTNGLKNKSLKKRLSLLIKNSIVHFYADEKRIKKYAQLASSFKKMTGSKSVKDLFLFVSSFFNVSVPLFKLVLFWGRCKSKVYPLANYQTIFFEHTIGNKKFVIFQTLEFLDFINSLDKKSVATFMNEKGMFVGHTYFSVPMAYHEGKIFTASGEVHPKVAQNFEYLGQQIQQQKIWNPTVNELVAFWKEYTKVEVQLNEKGDICLKSNTIVPYKIIT